MKVLSSMQVKLPPSGVSASLIPGIHETPPLVWTSTISWRITTVYWLLLSSMAIKRSISFCIFYNPCFSILKKVEQNKVISR
jgi:hypothetical protein